MTKGTRCDEHAKRANPVPVNRHNDYTEFYSSKQWQGLRKIHINHNPLCVACLLFDRTQVGKHVDHIIPHRGNESIQLLADNLQTLCVPCHSKKTAKEQRGLYDDYVNNSQYSNDTSVSRPINNKRRSNDRLLRTIITISQAAT